ncbi:putative WRKY transcription factor 17 [Capsicum baccatum]|uniref:Putative WRKY transcription factor 17 n=1 Tax=Capsicum baccatum TaxID=33114 RepID=A0A2G2UV78_CAPBA|nr:putative WRKY transcription factor 17 [Capsicum baccatum]PHT26299.1 putative WRKY transcription factor 17 [Capsicum baccatum]
MNKELALQKAASTGLKTMEHLIKLAANEPLVQVDFHEIANFVVAKLKKENSIVGRTGHARFCPGPVQVQPQAQNDVKYQAQAHQSQDFLTLLSLSPYGYMDKERKSTSTNVVVCSGACNGISADRVNAWDAFGSMKNGMISSSFLLSITNEGNGSIANVALSSSMPLLSMAQVVFAGK